MTLVVIALALAVIVAPERGNARGEGCVAVGTHQVAPNNHRPWDCYYVATGPGYYVASTTNPFVIAVSENGAGWREIVRRSQPGPPTAGFLATQPGQHVSISISCWDYARSHPCDAASLTGARLGTIVAHSEL